MLQIFIGYIFIFLHFTINGFDLLADFIGYFLVYMGLSKFPDIQNFRSAKPFTLIMAVLNLAGTVLGNILPPVFVFGINVVSLILTLYIVFLVIGGIGELERHTRIYLKYDRMKSNWRLMAIFTAGSSVMAILSGEVFRVMSAMFGLAAMVTNIIFLYQLISVKEGMEQLRE